MMREWWLYRDYMHRWWLFLLLDPGLGALVGLGYYLQQHTPVEITATAIFSTRDQNKYLVSPGATLQTRLGYQFAVSSPTKSTDEAAIESLVTLAYRLETETNRRFEIQNTKMERSRKTVVWWKPIVLGSVIGALFAIGGVFGGEDVRNYLRYRQTEPPDT